MKKQYIMPATKVVKMALEEMICLSGDSVDVKGEFPGGGNLTIGENENDILNDFGGDDSKSLW